MCSSDLPAHQQHSHAHALQAPPYGIGAPSAHLIGHPDAYPPPTHPHAAYYAAAGYGSSVGPHDVGMSSGGFTMAHAHAPSGPQPNSAHAHAHVHAMDRMSQESYFTKLQTLCGGGGAGGETTTLHNLDSHRNSGASSSGGGGSAGQKSGGSGSGGLYDPPIVRNTLQDVRVLPTPV